MSLSIAKKNFMLKIGCYNELIAARVAEQGLYLNQKPDEVLLPLKYVPANTKPGDTLKVFVYTDSAGKPVATTLVPKAVMGDFAYLQVKDVVSFGAFIDWGLEKDLLVPTSEQHEEMQVGKKYVVKVCLDEMTGRVCGTNRITRNCDKNPKDLADGDKVSLLIYDITKIGVMAVINNRYSGMLYRCETYTTLSIGEKTEGYIGRIREDGKLDLTLKRPGYQSIPGSAASIMEILKKNGGFLPYHDKSLPDEISRIFAMSKKEFKRAIGGLYKAGSIEITDNGIRVRG
jgi:predicted RNA-binding protein (virulence factor B family)